MRAEMRAGNTVVANKVNIPLPTCGLRSIFLFVVTDNFGLLNLRIYCSKLHILYEYTYLDIFSRNLDVDFL